MKLLPAVILNGLDIRMRPALVTADRIWREHGQELVVTCGLNGVHSAGSLHYYGRALDFRTRYFSAGDKESVVNALRHSLSDDYDVVPHDTHCHVEYDPKGT